MLYVVEDGRIIVEVDGSARVTRAAGEEGPGEEARLPSGDEIDREADD